MSKVLSPVSELQLCLPSRKVGLMACRMSWNLSLTIEIKGKIMV
jgi:hypothetical protein